MSGNLNIVVTLLLCFRSSADLYEDHKRALLKGKSLINGKNDLDEDSVTLQKALKAGKSKVKVKTCFVIIGMV